MSSGCLIVKKFLVRKFLRTEPALVYLYHVKPMLMPAIEKINDAGGISADIPPTVWGYFRTQVIIGLQWYKQFISTRPLQRKMSESQTKAGNQKKFENLKI